ncbi:TPA: hypothetical protein ACX37U_004463, partial [Serratia marcescens]
INRPRAHRGKTYLSLQQEVFSISIKILGIEASANLNTRIRNPNNMHSMIDIETWQVHHDR